MPHPLPLARLMQETIIMWASGRSFELNDLPLPTLTVSSHTDAATDRTEHCGINCD